MPEIFKTAPHAIDNPEACGLGQGEQCCAFLAMAPEGFFCARTSNLMYAIFNRLIEGTMNAKYAPAWEIDFPDCQPFREEVASLTHL